MKTILTALALTLVLAGCHSKDEPPPVDKPKAGRAETQSIRNTDAVGMSGSAIADKVDAALDKNDKTVQDAQKLQDQVDGGQ